MIAYCYIRQNLKSLNYRYQRAKSIQDANYHSKLAILELCGWLEMAIDDAVTRAGNRLLKAPDSRRFLEDKIKYTYGFEYDRHLKSLIVALIGISGFETLEKTIDAPTLIGFKSELGILKDRRNSLAHTYTRGATQHYDAPSITMSRLPKVEAGIRAYDEGLRAL